jgi:uncharacterized membrane protein
MDIIFALIGLALLYVGIAMIVQAHERASAKDPSR